MGHLSCSTVINVSIMKENKFMYRGRRCYDPEEAKTTPKGKSETVPGESFTVRELYLRHQQGLETGMGAEAEQFQGEPGFDDDSIFNKPDFDLTDIAEEKRRLEIKKEKITEENRKKKESKKKTKEKEENEKKDDDSSSLSRKKEASGEAENERKTKSLNIST